MKRTFKSRDANTWKNLYTSYIRPHLEFAVPVWNPYAKGDIEKLEKIQHKATKVSHTLKNLDYQSRCKELNLTTLEKRRTRGDLIQKFKIENKMDEINWEFEPTVLPPRGGHRGYFQRELIKDCNQRYNFFNNRIVNVWNSLPDEIVAATSKNVFKKRLDDFL